MGKAFGVTPAALGTLTFIRSLVQAAASPLAAYLAIKHDRIVIIASGALAWGVATALVGVCTAYWQVFYQDDDDHPVNFLYSVTARSPFPNVCVVDRQLVAYKSLLCYLFLIICNYISHEYAMGATFQVFAFLYVQPLLLLTL